ncbi:MAG: decaprenyl-phosphate phosphoribosyltransferase, partial [Kiritimatiellia bacterium]
ALSRPDHWFKNLMMLPGYVIAAFIFDLPLFASLSTLGIAFAATCLMASANYVLNDWLDARFDQFHPVKRHRPLMTQQVGATIIYLEYGFLVVAGFGLGLLVSKAFAVVLSLLWMQGILYNVRPLRTKERVYIDVISEAVNNPIRLFLGWFVILPNPWPPSSLIISYWMGGAFLMAVKRFAEFRFINDPSVAALYRRSFAYYTEDRLLISAFFYGACSALFFGVFMVKYRIELVFSLPLLAWMFTWYLYIGMKPDSPAQRPESLYRESGFMLYVLLVAVFVTVMLFIDIPWVHQLSENAFTFDRP